MLSPYPENLSNITAEFQMLGAFLTHNELVERIPFLEEQHFLSPSHQKIFRSIVREVKKGKLANCLTLKAEYADDPEFAEAGGATYLAAAMGQSHLVLSPIDHAHYLVELAQRRALFTACTHAAHVLEFEPQTPPAETALQLGKEFEAVSRGFGMPRLETDFDVTEQVLTDLKSELKPFSTGLSRLDNAMDGGLFPGKAYGFAARKKVGKTILASTISCNLNELGVKHLFICGEMSPKEIHQRTLARLTDSFPSAFRSSYGQSAEFQRKIADAAVRSKRATFYYNAPALTFDELRRVVITAALGKGIKGFILDYWQLVGGKGKKGPTEHLDEVAQWIAEVCRKYNLFAVVMAQLNQENNTRGGEGMRLAFDQVYKLDRVDLTQPDAYLEMMDTRYTAWGGVGDEKRPGLWMNEKGPYFQQYEL